MSLFGKREQGPSQPPQPSQPKSLGGMFRESLFGSPRSMPKPEQKPQAKPMPGGENKYRAFGEWNLLAKKFDNKSIPGLGGKVYKSESGRVMSAIQEQAKKMGKKSGMYPKNIGDVKDKYSILGRMQEQVYEAKRRNDWSRAKQLQRDIKIAEQMKKELK